MVAYLLIPAAAKILKFLGKPDLPPILRNPLIVSREGFALIYLGLLPSDPDDMIHPIGARGWYDIELLSHFSQVLFV